MPNDSFVTLVWETLKQQDTDAIMNDNPEALVVGMDNVRKRLQQLGG